jgi:hypothetical protein
VAVDIVERDDVVDVAVDSVPIGFDAAASVAGVVGTRLLPECEEHPARNSPSAAAQIALARAKDMQKPPG